MKKTSALLCPGWHPDFWAPHKTSKQKKTQEKLASSMQHFFCRFLNPPSTPSISCSDRRRSVADAVSNFFFSCVVRSHACNFCSQKLRGVKCGICFASRSHTSKFQDVREKTYKFPASVMQLWDVNLWNLKKPCPFQPVQGRPVRGFSRCFFRWLEMSSWPCLLQSLPVDGLQPVKQLKIGHSNLERDPSSNHPFSGCKLAGFVSGRIKNTNFQDNLGLSYGTFPRIPREPNMHFAPPSYIVIHFLQKKSAELPVAQKIGIKALIEQCPKLMVKFKFKTYKIMIPYHIIPYHAIITISYHIIICKWYHVITNQSPISSNIYDIIYNHHIMRQCYHNDELASLGSIDDKLWKSGTGSLASNKISTNDFRSQWHPTRNTLEVLIVFDSNKCLESKSHLYESTCWYNHGMVNHVQVGPGLDRQTAVKRGVFDVSFCHNLQCKLSLWSTQW